MKRLKLVSPIPRRSAVIGLCVAMAAATAVVTGPTGTARAAGTPNIDTTYGAGGLTTIIAERGTAVLDADGRTLWAHADRVTEAATLTRLTVGGVVDPGFGGDGSVDLPFEGALHVHADGTISVTAVPDSGTGISVHRISGDGDTSSTATVLSDVPLERVRSVSERANGDLIVSAFYQDTLPVQEHVVAITSGGDLNTGWGAGGDLLIDTETLYGAAATGDSVVTVTDAKRVRRYNPAGDLDATFDVDLPEGFQPNSVHADEDAYYISGTAIDVTQHMAVVKVLAAGYRDPAFGAEGMAVGAAHECGPAARRSFVTATGVYLIGHNGDCSASKTYVQRFTPTGFADPSFGTTGEMVVDEVGARRSGNSDGGGVQPDGKVVVAFGSTDGSLSVTRLLPRRTAPFVALTATKVLSGYVAGARKPVVLTIRGKGGVPADGVAAVALNVTVSAAKNAGGVIAYPSDGAAPRIYTNAHNAQQPVIQRLTVPLSQRGQLTLVNNSAGTAALTVVIVGYYRTGAYQPRTPSRLVTSTVAARGFVTVPVAGRGGVPLSGVAGVILNVTVRGAAAGSLTVYPTGAVKPSTTVAGRTAGRPGNAGVTVTPGANGRVTLVNNSAAAATVTADVVGYMPS